MNNCIMFGKASGLIFNEDCTHFFCDHPESQMTRDGLRAFIDQYAGTQVTSIMFNVNSQRTSYASDVWERYWDVDDKDITYEKMLSNMSTLYNCGLDPYSIWLERCREVSIAPWISVRMNDIHDADNLAHCGHSSFWREHPEYWRVPDGQCPWYDRAFDYEHQAVREHIMALIDEVLERYDMDGLELDWMREPYCFAPGREQQGLKILTEFVELVRNKTIEVGRRRGHHIGLAVRVPAQPQTAAGLGLDVVRWCKEGLVDWIIPSPRWQTADFDIPINLWNELLMNVRNRIHLSAGLDTRIQSRPDTDAFGFSRLETLRGFSSAMLHQGADDIYLFNHMDNGASAMEDLSEFPVALREGGSLKTLAGKPRRHVVTFTDIIPPGVARKHILPQTITNAIPAQIRIYTGPRIETGRVILRFGLDKGSDFTNVKFSAKLNSNDCTAIEDAKNLMCFPGTLRVVQFEAPLSSLNCGYNLLECWTIDGLPQVLAWAELYIIPEGNER